MKTPGQTRSPRFKRPRNLPLLPLTEREKHVIRLVYDYGRITSHQLVALLPGSVQKNRRLFKRLFLYRYLNRKKISNNAPILYSPGNRGAHFIAEDRGIARKRIDWTTKNREAGHNHLKHLLGINTFRCALDVSLDQLPGAQLFFWYPDNTFRRSVTYTDGFARKTIACTPDSFYGVLYHGHRFGGLVEFDNSTVAGTTKKEASRIFEKLEARWHLWLKWREREYTDRFGVDSLRLFYITKSEQRKENIRALAKSVGDQNNGSEFFWFTCQKSYLHNPFTVLDAIWQTPKDDGYKSMFDDSSGIPSMQHNDPDDRDRHVSLLLPEAYVYT